MIHHQAIVSKTLPTSPAVEFLDHIIKIVSFQTVLCIEMNDTHDTYAFFPYKCSMVVKKK